MVVVSDEDNFAIHTVEREREREREREKQGITKDNLMIRRHNLLWATNIKVLP